MENKKEFFEPKVGEIAYFWNKLEDGYCQAKLLDVTNRFYTTMGVFAHSSSEIPPIDLKEIEEELPYKGQICWGKGKYLKGFHIGHFVEKIDGIYKLSSSNDIEEGFFSCNEITTKNPYQTVEEYNQQGLEKYSHEVEEEDKRAQGGGYMFLLE